MPQIHKQHSIDLYPSQLNSNLQVLHLFDVYPEVFATCLRHCGHVTELKRVQQIQIMMKILGLA